jgi:PAS domain S-box-containing protein
MSFHLDRHFLVTCLDQTDAVERDTQSRLLDSVLENSEAAIYAFDTTGRMLLADPTTRRLFRHGEQNDPIGQVRSTLVPRESERLYAKHDLEVYRTRQPILFEETLKQADGTLRHFVSQKFPIIDQKGSVTAVGGVSTEVTKLKTMNARWELAAKVFENGSESILVTDGQQRITMVNRCFTETTGYTEEEVIGNTPSLLASGKHDDRFFREMFESIRTAGYWEGEIWNRRKQGDVYPEWMRITEVRDACGMLQHYVSISQASAMTSSSWSCPTLIRRPPAADCSRYSRPSSSRWNLAKTQSLFRARWASPCTRLTVKRSMIYFALPTRPCIRPSMPGATAKASSAARWASAPFAGWKSKWRWIRPSATMNSSFITSPVSCSEKTAWRVSKLCCAGTAAALGPSDLTNSFQ